VFGGWEVWVYGDVAIAHCIYIYLDGHMCTYNFYTHNMITRLA